MAKDKQLTELKEGILCDLKRINDRSRSFQNIIRSCNALHETLDFLEKENHRLRSQASKLQKVRLDSQSSIDDPNSEDAKSLALEKKIYELQKELTELHKNKGEHADKVIELRQALDTKEREISEKCSELDILQTALNISDEKKAELEEKCLEVEQVLQLMKDEHTALNITFSSVVQAKEKLEYEHDDLVSRWMVYKAKQADEFNAENSAIEKLKQVKLQRDMAEATREPVQPYKGHRPVS